MNSKPLWQISVETSPEAEEAVASLLERLFGEKASIYSTERGSRVSVFTASQSGRAVFKRKALQAGLNYIADCGLKTAPAKIALNRVPAQDWTESWKKHFKPIEINHALLIKPSWTKNQPRENQAVVVLDPGLSFGTGQHPTTHFCLAQLVRRRKQDLAQSFLDIGTGSGILAISAAKLGYSPVQAFDNDPQAVQVAKKNAATNGVESKISFTRRDIAKWPAKGNRSFDLICANLTDDVLIRHASPIVNRLKPNAVLVLAGILVPQFSSVQTAFETLGLQLVDSRAEDEWQSAAFAKTS